jgi:hypothetical protein
MCSERHVISVVAHAARDERAALAALLTPNLHHFVTLEGAARSFCCICSGRCSDDSTVRNASGCREVPAAVRVGCYARHRARLVSGLNALLVDEGVKRNHNS